MIAEYKNLTLKDQYDYAVALENEYLFKEALIIFTFLYKNPEFDTGDIAFHCGWCMEHLNPQSPEDIIKYYRISGKISQNEVCRYNSFFRIGWIYYHLKDFRAAAEAFKASIDLADSFENDIIQNAVFWYASSLESMGHYLKAIKWYDVVSFHSPLLDPESRRRKINCLINTGQFENALAVCYSFLKPPPESFDRDRYSELKEYAAKEIKIIESNL